MFDHHDDGLLRRVPVKPGPWSLISLGILTLVSACRACGSETKEHPSRYLAKEAEAVLEVRDLGALARSRKDVESAFASVITKEQVTELENELVLSLGFSPATEKGLEEAGLPTSGPIAVEVADSG